MSGGFDLWKTIVNKEKSENTDEDFKNQDSEPTKSKNTLSSDISENVILNNEEKFSEESSIKNIAKYCYNCGERIDKIFEYCPNCGSFIQNKNCKNKEKTCDKCATRNYSYANFCINCGRNLSIKDFIFAIKRFSIFILVFLILTTVYSKINYKIEQEKEFKQEEAIIESQSVEFKNIVRKEIIHSSKILKNLLEIYDKESLNKSEKEKELLFNNVYKKMQIITGNLNNYVNNLDNHWKYINYMDSEKEYYKKFGFNFYIQEGSFQFDILYPENLKIKNLPVSWKEYFILRSRQTLPYWETNDSLTPEQTRMAILDYENFIIKYPKFYLIENIKTDLRFLVRYYLFVFEGHLNMHYNEKTLMMKKEDKASYENFIQKNKSSIFYDLICKFYNESKRHNFKYSSGYIDTIREEFENIKL